MGPEERARVVEFLPGEVTWDEMAMPEGDRHFQAKVRTLDKRWHGVVQPLQEPFMIRPLLTLATCLAALTWAACASTAPSTQGGSTDSTSQPDSETQVTGSVLYRERIALTPAAVVQVEVVELAPEGSPGTVIGQQTIQSPGQVPIPFTVAINPQRLRADAAYVVNARITDEGRVFSTAAPVPVLTQGHRSSDVQVLVRSGG